MLDNDPLWYKDAIIYEVHVRAFHDSVGDGYGDFRGLTRKLDYLADLGVTAIWVLPFYPSPLRDDGYDIGEYTKVHAQYGKIEDFKEFLDAAHRRGIRVITELVINHTSDQHPWFQRARLAPPGSVERDFYVWSDTPERYKDARIIFKDFEASNWSWDPVAKAYYWHRFYSHQPDLNFDNPAVWEALYPVVDFWMGMGVDGMRLDAIPYLYEREGTNCENLPETHVYLKALRRHVDTHFPGRMFLAEANQWPEDAVAYFGEGDECHMSFHFPLMPRLFMALHQEDRFPIHDILAQTPAIHENCQWCIFLRNHDELTLEMVTDEERDYMYRAYAEDRTARINLGIRHRLAPLLKNDRRRIELMNALLFALPGTPVIYYGDEIGMGDNIYLGDRNGVRTPMQWSPDRNAGFSRANPQKLFLPVIIDPEYHYETVNVESQQNNASSLLWWMKRLIALRKRYKSFGRGSMELLRPDNAKVLSFIRKYGDECLLIVANLSRFVQYVQLDLREYEGVIPEELFGRTQFPRIGEQPYLLTLGPHGFLLFSLPGTPSAASGDFDPAAEEAAVEVRLPVLPGDMPLAERFQESAWDDLETILPAYIERRRLVTDPATITAVHVIDAFPIRNGPVEIWFVLVRVDSRVGMAETLTMALARVAEERADQLLMPLSAAGFARLHGQDAGILCHALAVPECDQAILKSILSGAIHRAGDREIAAFRLEGKALEEVSEESLAPIHVQRSQRCNMSVTFGESYILKTFRRVEEGLNPDFEIGRYLTNRPDYDGAAPVLGAIEYHRRGREPATLAVLRQYVPNQGTAWQLTLDFLSAFFERVAAQPRVRPPQPPAPVPILGAVEELTTGEPKDDWEEMIEGYRGTAQQLGRKTAALHLALAADPINPAFAPEPFGRLYQRSIYQSLRNLTGRLCERLARRRGTLPEADWALAGQLVAQRDGILERFRKVLDPEINGWRTRCHGDYHLGQLLFTGKDFSIIDFEGESHRAIGERRLKRSPLRDVATLVRSLDYAVQSVLLGLATHRGQPPGMIRAEDQQALAPWGFTWYNLAARDFVAEYMRAIRPAGLLPATDAACSTLLEVLLLEQALFEIDFELSERPKWVRVPLRGAIRLLSHDPDDPALYL